MRAEKDVSRAAIYLRISRDDEDKSESDSIQNQRDLLTAFIDSHDDLELADEFADDGYTGTNFERPGFQRMMDLAQDNTIDCIIVKDFSRLGRNYIETGRYIERIFPMMGIRFISVNDNYDSVKEFSDADQIIVPFKNLINDAYCRDISMKVRSQLDTKRKNGKFIGSFATYGYMKDPEDKHHLVIDDQAAEVVRQIFDLALEGYSPYHIADRLNEMGVLTPFQYKRSKGMNCSCGYWKGSDSGWQPTSIYRILSNEMYLGKMVQGKQRKINYKIKKFQAVDKKDWIIVPNMHEPIITQEVFDRVQRLSDMDTRTSPHKDSVGLFAGIIKCGDCGQNMVIRKVKKGSRTYTYYYCSTNKANEGCSSHLINASKIERVVLEEVQHHMDLLLDAESLAATMDRTLLEEHRMKVLSDQIKALDNDLERYQELKNRLHEDLGFGMIDADEYEELKERYVMKIGSITLAKQKALEKRACVISESALPSDWMDEVRKYGHITKLSRKMVNMLIDEIKVYDKNRIEITFHYGDVLQCITELSRKQAESVMDRRAAV